MTTPAEYIVDFTSVSELTEALPEYFAMGVVPVKSDNAPRPMSSVKLHVLLPLERELFFTGIVIMHRPGGFLVQLDTPPDMQFLNDTIKEHALSLAREASASHKPEPQPSNPLQDKIFEDRPQRPEPRTEPRTERMGALNQPHVDTVEDVHVQHRDAWADLLNDDIERPTDVAGEKTRPGVKKRPAAHHVEPAPADNDDEFNVSISAVDAVTGRAKPIRPRTGQTKNMAYETRQFGNDSDLDEAVEVVTDDVGHRQTAKQEFKDISRSRTHHAPDPNRTIRMKPVPKSRAHQDSEIDELFELAETAGAPGITEDRFGDSHLAEISGGVDNISTEPSSRFSDNAEAETVSDELKIDQSDHSETDYDDSGPLDKELAVSIREMPTPEKQRLARQGKRIARRILIRDNDKTVHKFVFFNPDVKLDEVIEYTRSNALASDAIEFICTNRKWMDSHDVALNIVRNNSTPIEIAVRLVIKLTQNDWRMLSRPGVARPPVMNQARRLLQGCE